MFTGGNIGKNLSLNIIRQLWVKLCFKDAIGIIHLVRSQNFPKN